MPSQRDPLRHAVRHAAMARPWPLRRAVLAAPLAGLALLAPLVPDALLVLDPARAAGRSDAAPSPELRVLLQEGPALTVRAAGATRLRLRDGSGKALLVISGERPLRLRWRAGQVEAEPDPVVAAAPGALPVPGQARTESLPMPVRLSELWLEPVASADSDPALWLQKRRYRGRLQIRTASEQLQAINVLPLETYLPSVVGSEMPASWPLDALRAQAVAARTYALKGRKPGSAFDLKATVASQVYKGLEAETASTRAAVADTRGLVLTYGDSLIDAVFHSSAGGVTESSGDLWPRQLPYLVSVPDFDQTSPVREWRQPLDPTLLRRAFAEIGGVAAIQVLATTASGRVKQARVLGPAGQLVLTGPQLRSRLGLKSTFVRFELQPLLPGPTALSLPGLEAGPLTAGSGALTLPGQAPLDASPPLPLPATTRLPAAVPAPQLLVAVGRGFGHGVGMSQWGAFAMASRGTGFEQILRHYYRGARLQPYTEVPGLALATGFEGRGDTGSTATALPAGGRR
ncbi:SpoIID/LytB domain-containing protein [Vulcanococcus limneticus]|uniref:SpoIID/LytB domain-containing protein n=1 Tax=Vulcanococcus limneticus TaxID=2170428 RepID=UPI00398BCA6F